MGNLQNICYIYISLTLLISLTEELIERYKFRINPDKLCNVISPRHAKWIQLGLGMEYQNDQLPWLKWDEGTFRCGLHGQQAWELYTLDQKLDGVCVDYALSTTRCSGRT